MTIIFQFHPNLCLSSYVHKILFWQHSSRNSIQLFRFSYDNLPYEYFTPNGFNIYTRIFGHPPAPHIAYATATSFIDKNTYVNVLKMQPICLADVLAASVDYIIFILVKDR